MDTFFRDPTEVGYGKRLRAVIQQNLTDFADDMRQKGHTVEIVEYANEKPSGQKKPTAPEGISRSDYMEQVRQLMQRSRGRELPGTFNPLVVSELFSDQCAPWEELAAEISDLAVSNAENTLCLILHHVASEEIAEALLVRVINPAMESIKSSLKGKLRELLVPHISGHPITYNLDLTENIQKEQTNRLKRKLEDILGETLHASTLPNSETRYNFNPRVLIDSLEDGIDPDMDHHACSLAIDTMQAYYKVTLVQKLLRIPCTDQGQVAMKKYVDYVSVLAIEQCLLQRLPGIFTTEGVVDMGDDEVQRIASESSDTAAERLAVKEKRQVLEVALVELKRLRKLHVKRSP